MPYLMSSHPGSTLKEAVELAEYLRDLGYMPEQVQDFYPRTDRLKNLQEQVKIPVRIFDGDMQRDYIFENCKEN